MNAPSVLVNGPIVETGAGTGGKSAAPAAEGPPGAFETMLGAAMNAPAAPPPAPAGTVGSLLAALHQLAAPAPSPEATGAQGGDEVAGAEAGANETAAAGADGSVLQGKPGADSRESRTHAFTLSTPPTGTSFLTRIMARLASPGSSQDAASESVPGNAEGDHDGDDAEAAETGEAPSSKTAKTEPSVAKSQPLPNQGGTLPAADLLSQALLQALGAPLTRNGSPEARAVEASEAQPDVSAPPAGENGENPTGHLSGRSETGLATPNAAGHHGAIPTPAELEGLRALKEGVPADGRKAEPPIDPTGTASNREPSARLLESAAVSSTSGGSDRPLPGAHNVVVETNSSSNSGRSSRETDRRSTDQKDTGSASGHGTPEQSADRLSGVVPETSRTFDSALRDVSAAPQPVAARPAAERTAAPVASLGTPNVDQSPAGEMVRPKIDRVTLDFGEGDTAGRLRVALRGTEVRATIIPADGVAAVRLEAGLRELQHHLVDRGFSDAQITVQAPRGGSDSTVVYAPHGDGRTEVAEARTGSTPRDASDRDRHSGSSTRDDSHTADQRPSSRQGRGRQEKGRNR